MPARHAGSVRWVPRMAGKPAGRGREARARPRVSQEKKYTRMKVTKIQLNNRELATVLAALRLFQSEADYDSDAVYSMEQLSEHEPLGNDEIEELCRRLNRA